MEEAKKKLGSAKQFAQSGEDDMEIARMESLATYVAGFWNGVRESMKGLQVTDELQFNGTVAAVVDSDANGITLHTPGKNHEFTIRNMPASLAMTLAQRWFDQSAANKLCLGAFQAVDPQGDKGEARRFWESATSGGAPADDLMPLLSGAAAEFAPPAGGNAALPSEKQLALAAKQVKLAFGADYKAAKTPDLKVELGKKLIEVAAETENPPDRYALLREALDLAAAGGSAMVISDAAEQIASAFNVDAAAEFKGDGLARCGCRHQQRTGRQGNRACSPQPARLGDPRQACQTGRQAQPGRPECGPQVERRGVAQSCQSGQPESAGAGQITPAASIVMQASL